MPQNGAVTVVGSYMHDVNVAVDRFPGPGETRMGTSRLESHGGKGGNQAVQAALCGARTGFVVAVGDDAAGRAAMAFWRERGMDASAAVAYPGGDTGLALILVNAAGQNLIVVEPGANSRLSAADVDRGAKVIGAATIVVAQLETPQAATIRAFEIAHAAGGLTLLNAAPAQVAPEAALVALTDILVVNEIESTQMAGVPEASDKRDVARHLLARVRRAVILTLGEGGALLFEKGQPVLHQPALAVRAIDTTGAGDAFIGAFAAHWAMHQDMQAALRHGVAAGSLACTKRGTVPSLATRDEIEAALARLPNGA